MSQLTEDLGEPYAILTEVVNIGRKVEGTKKKIRWLFGFSEKEWVIEIILVHSVTSGKKTIFEDGKEIVTSTNRLATKFEHVWRSEACHVDGRDYNNMPIIVKNRSINGFGMSSAAESSSNTSIITSSRQDLSFNILSNTSPSRTTLQSSHSTPPVSGDGSAASTHRQLINASNSASLTTNVVSPEAAFSVVLQPPPVLPNTATGSGARFDDFMEPFTPTTTAIHTDSHFDFDVGLFTPSFEVTIPDNNSSVPRLTRIEIPSPDPTFSPTVEPAAPSVFVPTNPIPTNAQVDSWLDDFDALVTPPLAEAPPSRTLMPSDFAFVPSVVPLVDPHAHSNFMPPGSSSTSASFDFEPFIEPFGFYYDNFRPSAPPAAPIYETVTDFDDVEIFQDFDMMFGTDAIPATNANSATEYAVTNEEPSYTTVSKDADLTSEVALIRTLLMNMEEERLCVVCQEQPKSVVLLPCRHLCVCEECSAHDLMQLCPMCREHIENKMIVFM